MSSQSLSPSSSYSPKLKTATHSSTTSTSTSGSAHHLPPSASSLMSEEDDHIPPTATSPLYPHTPTTSTTSLLPSPITAHTPSFPIREDCWSEDATHTLVEAWGSHYIRLNRGNLRQKQWQEVADAVNFVHGHTKKLRRTDIQCKNRIDTLKKKYKIEKAKFIKSNGRYASPWPFFSSLDSLIGDSLLKPNPPSPPRTRKVTSSSLPAPSPVKKEFLALLPPPSIVPVGPRSKRPAHGMVHSEDLRFRQKFRDMGNVTSVVRRKGEEEDEEYEESETSSGVANGNKRRKRRIGEEGKVAVKGYGQLAEAIGRFGEIYKRVEEAKQRQIFELEKQRMQFGKDLEIQRMKLFMESQLHLEKLRLSKSKHRSQAGGYP